MRLDFGYGAYSLFATASSVLAEECHLVTYLAWAHQAAGNGEAALRVADEAMELVDRRGRE